MKNQKSSRINDLINNDQDFTIGNNNFKTTNINILLNRVRQEKKSNKKKRIILSISIISFTSLISILVFGN